MEMKHTYEEIILDDNEINMMMLSMKRNFTVQWCGYLADRVDKRKK